VRHAIAGELKPFVERMLVRLQLIRVQILQLERRWQSLASPKHACVPYGLPRNQPSTMVTPASSGISLL